MLTFFLSDGSQHPKVAKIEIVESRIDWKMWLSPSKLVQSLRYIDLYKKCLARGFPTPQKPNVKQGPTQLKNVTMTPETAEQALYDNCNKMLADIDNFFQNGFSY